MQGARLVDPRPARRDRGRRPGWPAVHPGCDRLAVNAAEPNWRSGVSTMTEGPGAEVAPPTFIDKERAPGQDWLSDLGEQERRELSPGWASTCRGCGGRCTGSTSCTGAWGSPSWLAWP